MVAMKEKVEMAHIFLIDDQSTVRRGLNQLLSQESHIVCGEAGNRNETFERIGSSGADMVVLDISLGYENGLELLPELREMGIAVLVFSMHEDADTISRAFAAGANGYVTKREIGGVLLAAVSDVLAGKRHISPRAAQSLASRVISLLKVQ